MEIFHEDIGKLAKRNCSFRRVVSTTDHTQVLVVKTRSLKKLSRQ